MNYKTVHPMYAMYADRCLSDFVTVTLVYCGQTVG